jgi:hypothetical protein
VEPGLSSAAEAAAIRPAGQKHIGMLGHFVNLRRGVIIKLARVRALKLPHPTQIPEQESISGLTQGTG